MRGPVTFGPNVYWIDSHNNGDGTHTHTIYGATDSNPTPTTLGENVANSEVPTHGLVTNGTDLVWMNFNTPLLTLSIWTMPVEGGTVEHLVSSQPTNNAADYHLAVDDTHVYWVQELDDCFCTSTPCDCAHEGSSTLWRVPLAGGSPELLHTFTAVPVTAMVLDDTYVHLAGWGYWATNNQYPNGWVLSCAKAGDFSAADLNSGYKPHKAGALAVNDTYAFWVADDHNLQRAELGDNSIDSNDTLSNDLSGSLLVLDESTLYVVSYLEAPPVKIVKIGINGGSLEEVVPATLQPEIQSYVQEFNVSDSYVYWNMSMGGATATPARLYRTPK
jgi:hypothetical protein